MAGAVLHLPPEQREHALAAYRAAVAAKRNRLFLGLLILCRRDSVSPALPVRSTRGSFSTTSIGCRTTSGASCRSFPGRTSALTSPSGSGISRNGSKLLVDTLLIAYLGTLLGFLGAFALCFAATGNLEKRRWVRIVSRRFLEFCRSVPEIVFALLFVVAFGLGPMPGVLALTIHTLGALGKQFAEVVENIDMNPVEGATATGASRASAIRFAVLPQVMSNFASYTLLRFEINVRGAAVMGFVGAGGIGQDLMEAIRKFYYSDVSAILVLIIATVMLIDLATERLRHALIGLEHRP